MKTEFLDFIEDVVKQDIPQIRPLIQQILDDHK